jgi:lysophospholipase L1-like esterase
MLVINQQALEAESSAPTHAAEARSETVVPNEQMRDDAESSGTPASATEQPIVRVYESSQEDAPALRAIKRLLDGSKPLTWVFTGDSITHGGGHTQGGRSYSEHFAERVRWELKRFLDVVINTGVSGDRVRGLSKNVDWRVLRFRPDLVSVMLGLNDSGSGVSGRQEFRDRLASLVDRLRNEGAIVLLNTPNRINLLKARDRLDLPGYVQIIRDVADEFELPLVDHWSHWEEAKSAKEGMPGWLANDGVHPDRAGHRELARLLFAELDIFDARSPTCRDLADR